ncbi:probable WRKY transcription factor protein 1 isoform X2 [Microplitis demolitor]|uniref:probable WRKY transcription factor protein 1 isoform X2 n=1 Tax=Microplitis demolitor TaxID=69319 RepID=UPI0006D50A3B|nr:probable WRKY transcription factor protein 1 isoform X2 [Microplitis demolitor]
MPRLRSRLTSKENTNGDVETKKPTKTRGTVGSKVVTAKKKGIEDKAADGMRSKPGESVAMRRKKSEDLESGKAAVKDITKNSRGSKGEEISPRPSSSSSTSGTAVTDVKKKNLLAKAGEKVTAKSEEVAGKKVHVKKLKRLVEPKPESRVSTRAKKTDAAAAADKLKPPSKVSKNKPKGGEEKLSLNKSDTESEIPAAKVSDEPKEVKIKSVVKKSADVSPKRSLRGRKSREADKPAEKKFFKLKSKITASAAHSKISPTKKPVLGAKQKIGGGKRAGGKIGGPKVSTSFRLRQTTIKESLANLSKKALRPRPPQKNYNEASRINKSISPTKKKAGFEKKGPVYKEKMNESNGNNKEDNPDKIYEFNYDLNDSQERAGKRKKKTRKAPVKRVKAKAAIKTKTAATKGPKPAVTSSTKVPEKVVATKPAAPVKANVKPDENNRVTLTVAAEVYNPPSSQPVVDNEPAKVPEKKHPRPVVISCQELSGENRINWTTTPVQPKPMEEEASGPSRPYSQRPSIQMKTMMNTSLLRRSLSPISKETPSPFIEDTGSPWRPIPLNSFSRVRNVFQSTPQGKKFSNLLGKASAAENKRLSTKMDKIAEIIDENSVSKKNESSKNIQINNSKSPRKFGTEISNIDNTITSNREGMSTSKSPRKFGSDISNSNNSLPVSPVKKKLSKSSVVSKEKSSVFNENKLSVSSTNSIDRGISIQETPVDENLDKENSAPNYQSPSKTPRKISRSPGNTPFKGFPSSRVLQESTTSPFKGFPRQLQAPVVPEVRPEPQPEFEPQPGPSGLQKNTPPTDTWKLKQSNLNKYLNLPEMPTSTRISTAHGLFEDMHTSPIEGKVAKKTIPEKLDVDNAFGFDDDDNHYDDSNASYGIDNYDIDNTSAQIPDSPKKESEKNGAKTQALERINNNNKINNNNNNNEINIKNNNKNHNNNDPELKKATRFSLGEIKRTLRSNTDDNKNAEQGKNIPEAAIKGHQSPTKKVVPEVVDYSNTFDIFSDEETDKQNNDQTVGLFEDPLPVHFHAPPRYSYKRKRRNRLTSCGHTDDEDDEEEHKRVVKKKKVSKVEREQMKKLEDWAKNVNKTFEEIEHFDLVVE